MGSKTERITTFVAASERNNKASAVRILVVVSLSVVAYLWVFGNTRPHRVTPHKSGVHWKACPDNDRTVCGYLDVPMDYLNSSSNEKVSLFLRKLPADPEKGSEYMGPILINPGGPGASGNEDVLGFGEDLYDLLDGRYDVIGFDPRGVNMTLPPLNCQPTPAEAAHLQESLQHLGIQFEVRHSISENASAAVVHEMELAFTRKQDAFAAAIARSCSENGNKQLLGAVGTSFVARDMRHILQALGELDRGLNYYGKSYGTLLGYTFAAMFPQHVNRMVLDGVVDAIIYYRDFLDHGRLSIVDTNKTAAAFYSSCSRAGPKRCALASTVNTTTDEIRRRVEEIYVVTARNPIPVPASAVGTGVLTASDVKLFFFTSMYNPRTWPILAQGLVDAERRTGTAVFESLYGYFVKEHKANYTDNVFRKHAGSGFLSTIAVMCGETNQSALNTEEYLAYSVISVLSERIGPIGKVFAVSGACGLGKSIVVPGQLMEDSKGLGTLRRNLQARKAYLFSMNRFPLLFISQVGDPVTPLRAAQTMVSAFGEESAALLVQNGYGHCSHAHPSLCTAKRVREYYFHGKLPGTNASCAVEDGFLFPDSAGGNNWNSDIEAVDVDDRRLLDVLDRLSKHVAK